MQAYHPEASRNHAAHNEAPSSRQHPYNMAPQRLPAAMNSNDQLDTWTLYELAKEKQKLIFFGDIQAKKVEGGNPSPSSKKLAKKKKANKKTAKSSPKKSQPVNSDSVAAQPLSSSSDHEELDPWTLYELEQGTQDQEISKSSKAKLQQETESLSRFLEAHKKTTKKRANSSGTKSQQDDKKIGSSYGHILSKNRARQYPYSPDFRGSAATSAAFRVDTTRKSRNYNRNVLLPLGRTYPEHIRQRIATAKSKRKSLLSEVTHKLYHNSMLEDCNSSLPNILRLDEEDKDLTFDFRKEEKGGEDDHHSSCYF